MTKRYSEDYEEVEDVTFTRKLIQKERHLAAKKNSKNETLKKGHSKEKAE